MFRYFAKDLLPRVCVQAGEVLQLLSLGKLVVRLAPGSARKDFLAKSESLQNTGLSNFRTD